MALVKISPALKEKISTAMTGNKSCIFAPVAVFYNGEGYRQQWNTLVSFSILQDFTGNIADVIQGSILMHPKEIKALIPKMQDLHGSFTFTPMRAKDLTVATESDMFIITGRILLDFKEDLNKLVGAYAYTHADDGSNEKIMTPDQAQAQYEVTFHVIEEDVYTLRNTKMNAIIRDATPESVIHWVADRLGAESVSAITPDNKQKYNNMIIPPLKGAQDIMPYLQQRYGVYSKGMGYYYTGKKMYIYPKSDQELSTSPVQTVVHLIDVPQNNYIGANAYHNELDQEIYIAATGTPNTSTTTTEAVENNGNVHVSLQTDRIKDNLFTTSTNGTVTRNPNTLSTVTLQNTGANMSQTTQKVVYDGELSNPYVSTSNMADTNMTLLTTSWIHAKPRLLEPGQTIYYHYDGPNGEYKIQQGRLQKVLYTSEPYAIAGMPTQSWFVFTAALEVRLVPDLISESEIQTINT